MFREILVPWIVGTVSCPFLMIWIRLCHSCTHPSQTFSAIRIKLMAHFKTWPIYPANVEDFPGNSKMQNFCELELRLISFLPCYCEDR